MEIPEGTGDAVDLQERSLAYIEDHLLLIERYANRIPLSDKASMRWKSSNRSGGSRRRGWEYVKQAKEQELHRREADFR